MRHRKNFNHLGRKSGHRKAMLANMASSLIMHKRISTTTAKAKALRMYVEPILTKSKEDSTHSRRVVFSYLNSKDAVSELFREISPKIAERPGGYTRILKTGNRLGDNAEMCVIELVDYNENMLGGAADSKSKGRRRRRGGKKKGEAEVQTQATQAEVQQAEPVSDENIEEAATETVEEQQASSVENKEETTETVQEEVAEDVQEEVAAPDEEVTEAKAKTEEEPSASAPEEPETGETEEEKKE